MTTRAALAAIVFALLTGPLGFAAERFVHEEGKFSIQLPEGLTTAKSGVALIAEGKELRIEVEPNKLTAGVTVHDYVVLNNKANEQIYEKYKKIKGGSVSTSINSLVPFVTFSFKSGEQTMQKSTYHVYNAADRRIIMISYITSPESHETKRAEFEQVLRSLGMK
jgi:hypothetical protein